MDSAEILSTLSWGLFGSYLGVMTCEIMRIDNKNVANAIIATIAISGLVRGYTGKPIFELLV